MKNKIFFSFFFIATVAWSSLPRSEGNFYSSPLKGIAEKCSDFTYFGQIDEDGKPTQCYKNCQRADWSEEKGERTGYQFKDQGMVVHGKAERRWWSYEMVNFEKNVPCQSSKSSRRKRK